MNEFFISRVPLFASLPAGEIKQLAETLDTITIADNTILLHEGERGASFYLVLEGTFEIVKALGTPDERVLRVVGPGNMIGEMSLLNRDGIRTASVRACSEGKLLEMRHADFDALLSRQPSIAYDMARTLSMRLRETDDAMIRSLHEKNAQLTRALHDLQAAQAQLIEKETLERELEVARQIQESILPRSMPRLAGFNFGARIVPARSVGGDLFDFIPLDDHTLGIVVADVSGKGWPAAIFMALARSLLRAEATRGDHPGHVLRSANRKLIDMNGAGMFVTVLYGALDQANRTFTYARAGHEIPIVVAPAGTVATPPMSTGHPLGLIEDEDLSLDQQTLVIPPDGKLLLYTDGVPDVMDPQGGFFGIERLKDLLRKSHAPSAQALCDDILATVHAHHAAVPQYDDVTLVAVHAEP